MTTLWIILFLCILIGVFAIVGYPVLLFFLDKVINPRPLQKANDYEPNVTLMIVAHNEEKVILEKLENAVSLDYPKENLEILVASDNSTDQTNEIVTNFIAQHPAERIRLYKSTRRAGKTNAQNEAQKNVQSEILVMTDSNTLFERNVIRELVASFSSPDIVYVCGALIYKNSNESLTSDAESTYWNLDLKIRDIESRIQTITAGNGAVYACRNKDYVDFEPLKCHDSAMPIYYALRGKRAIFNPAAIAYEKAGETIEDEFSRKVRMNRIILQTLKEGFNSLNVFKYRWFSFFYFGHRICRYLLWIIHIIAFLSSIGLAFLGSYIGMILTILQCIGVLITFSQIKNLSKNRMLRMLGYYGITVFAQIVGVYRTLTNKAKPTWDAAESTR